MSVDQSPDDTVLRCPSVRPPRLARRSSCSLVNCQKDCLKGRNRMIQQHVAPCQRPSEAAPYKEVQKFSFLACRRVCSILPDRFMSFTAFEVLSWFLGRFSTSSIRLSVMGNVGDVMTHKRIYGMITISMAPWLVCATHTTARHCCSCHMRQ